MPTASVLARAIGSNESFSQLITLTPTSSSTIESAIEALMQASSQIKKTVAKRRIPLIPSVYCGCPTIVIPSIDEAVQVIF